MKKLKNKVYLTIFLLLTGFLLSILVIFNYQDYTRENNNIKDNLTKINERHDEDKRPGIPPSEDNNKDIANRIFMDLVVYTVKLDNDNNIVDIYSHNEDANNLDNIKKKALKIINSNDKDRIYIGNLYVSKYSYSYKSGDYITIIDNSNIKNILTNSLRNSLIIFMVLEVIIIIVTRYITNWLVRPAIESFKKQKEFIADASHELKTPLAVIMANADALEDEPNDSKWLNNIKAEVMRMSKLISDLLNLATIDNEDAKKKYSKINLSRELEKQVLIFESLAYENKVSIEYDIDKDIYFICDIEQIKQLISILIDNAIKHSYKNKTINVDVKQSKHEIIIKVINNGKEIPSDKYDKIFERFYRMDKSRNRRENRYGLGLAIAQSIVTSHNGNISVKSENNFTTFKVIFKKN